VTATRIYLKSETSWLGRLVSPRLTSSVRYRRRMPQSGDLPPTEYPIVERANRVANFAQIAECVARTRAALAARGMAAKPSSALASLFSKADRILRERSTGSNDVNLSLLMEAEEAFRIAQAVLAVVEDPAAREPIRRITKSDMHLAKRQVSQGKDALWELDLLSHLRRSGAPAELKDPPDIEVTLPGLLGPFGIACKKVYSEESVENQFSVGLRQLKAYDGCGLVAFNIDDLTPEGSYLQSPDMGRAATYLYALNLGFIQRHLRHFEAAARSNRCDGVWVATNGIVEIPGGAPTFNRFTQHTIWTARDAGLASEVRIAAIRMFVKSG
jgi:hypothetical protein